MKNIRLVAFAVAVLVCLALLLNPVGNKGSGKKEDQKEILIAVEQIPAQAKITPEMVQIKKISQENFIEGSLSDVTEAVGKVSKNPIYSGEVILPEKIVDAESQKAGLAFSLAPNTRAFTLQVELEQGMAGLIKVGNFVDVIGVLERPDNESIKGKQSVAVVQDKQVVALDKKITSGEEPVSEEILYASVTIQVSPEDTLKLALADEIGPLRLVLRPQNERQALPLPSVMIQGLVPQ